jgi:ribonucleoside-diphosphate reductase alpha chain
MGIHEWLLQRGYKYGPNDELAEWLDIYAESDDYAHDYAMNYSLTVPVKTRAIAPTGTIGIVAETTTGVEPIFCVAYKRRIKTAQALGGDKINYEYVVDPTAKRLIDAGANPDDIEDAYMLAYNYERRIEFQAWVQQWVDHGISSTINLPYPIVELDEIDSFAEILYKYLPKLRGITCYPDGSRGGQPLTAVPLEMALGQEGVVFEEDEANACASGACGA